MRYFSVKIGWKGIGEGAFAASPVTNNFGTDEGYAGDTCQKASPMRSNDCSKCDWNVILRLTKSQLMRTRKLGGKLSSAP